MDVGGTSLQNCKCTLNHNDDDDDDDANWAARGVHSIDSGSRMLPGNSWGSWTGDFFYLTNQQNTVICIAHERLKMSPWDAFWECKMCTNAFAHRAQPRTPLGGAYSAPQKVTSPMLYPLDHLHKTQSFGGQCMLLAFYTMTYHGHIFANFFHWRTLRKMCNKTVSLHIPPHLKRVATLPRVVDVVRCCCHAVCLVVLSVLTFIC